jgi:hypothetical protein
MVESFSIEMVKSGYYCDVDMWLSLLTIISISTYAFRFLWLVVEKNRLQLKKINCSQNGHFQL